MRALTPAFPRMLLVLGAGALLAVVWPVSLRMRREAEEDADRHRSAVSLCRVDLAYRAMEIRRFAEREGRLPESLAELEGDPQRILAWAMQGRPGSPLRSVDEPWIVSSGYPFLPATPKSPRPDVTQDLFGLPVLYERGPAAADAVRVRSSDPLPPSVTQWLTEQGGVPAASPAPFALEGLALREFLARSRADERRALVARLLLPFATGLLLVAGLLVRWSRRGRGPDGPAPGGGHHRRGPLPRPRGARGADGRFRHFRPPAAPQPIPLVQPVPGGAAPDPRRGGRARRGRSGRGGARAPVPGAAPSVTPARLPGGEGAYFGLTFFSFWSTQPNRSRPFAFRIQSSPCSRSPSTMKKFPM